VIGGSVDLFVWVAMLATGALALVCYAVAAIVRRAWARIRRAPQDEPLPRAQVRR
jgi:hypothetical protein